MENMEENKKETLPDAECPICCKHFPKDSIEVHVNRCIFLNCSEETTKDSTNKRSFRIFNANKTNAMASPPGNANKKVKNTNDIKEIRSSPSTSSIKTLQPSSTTNIIAVNEPQEGEKPTNVVKKSIPLAEKMRPETIDDYIGQNHVMGKDAILRRILDRNETPSMILWGPPGVGKTTLAHVIANRCKQTQNIRFVKLSATMAGVNDIKQAVAAAKNEQKFGRKTILFMDEIHRFNKLQQDIFLPHVESGVITLIGATTENPSFSLNSALLSRCRVIVLEKLTTNNILDILKRSLKLYEAIILTPDAEYPSFKDLGFIPKVGVEESSLKWLAEICDGDARIALNSLQLAMESLQENNNGDTKFNVKFMSLKQIKDGIKRSHMLYDRQGDQHYDMISALHKSIRASDDNAALYWCTRMMVGGEDPRYICRRLVRAASEDIGLADPQAVGIALSALDAVQLVGMPESDCIIAQAAVYLARAPKSREMDNALAACKRDINECKGPQPSVPLHLRNAPTKLMKDLNYGKGYNMQHKDISGLEYMPEGMEDRDYFS
ncbi:ATPase WRNIP1-like [Contarinia nasturtii]|uniref:ATPase WRNIP1-like n=1 Tax=Contarinia nasturtii TaxID=265458 RepID=UPI0012D3842A|nr:ATPase WRNIP1-like [Contarinia nasturtii]